MSPKTETIRCGEQKNGGEKHDSLFTVDDLLSKLRAQVDSHQRYFERVIRTIDRQKVPQES